MVYKIWGITFCTSIFNLYLTIRWNDQIIPSAPPYCTCHCFHHCRHHQRSSHLRRKNKIKLEINFSEYIWNVLWKALLEHISVLWKTYSRKKNSRKYYICHKIYFKNIFCIFKNVFHEFRKFFKSRDNRKLL